MSGSFAGFSEEDIRNLNSKRQREFGVKKALHSNQSIKKHTTTINHQTKKITTVDPIPDGAKLCRNPNPSEPATPKTETNVAVMVSPTQESITEQPEPENEKLINVEDRLPTTNEQDIPAVSNNFTQLREKKLDLTEFQERQKLIEEQNKKRKELLAKALAVRTQKTQEEAQKLEKIRKEFKKLDMLLSGDVKILRHQIEIASLDYMEAEKRYYRIEKEFLEAKLALHQKLERKEMLTEHLCAVIEKNEERKADKLNDLLSKLNLTTDFESTGSTTDNLPS